MKFLCEAKTDTLLQLVCQNADVFNISESELMEEPFLAEAIQLAIDSVADGGGPFGAVIVKGGQVIARGANRVTRDFDPTAHAEIVAIREACRGLQDFRLTDCTIYCSCEPCPMCLSACYWARLGEIVFSAHHSDAAASGFDDSFLHRELALPREHRSLPIRQALPELAQSPFDAWAKFKDRIEY